MKKETLKELGKFFLDAAKILLAIAVVTPIVQDAPVSNGLLIAALLIVGLLAASGLFLTNKGAKDE